MRLLSRLGPGILAVAAVSLLTAWLLANALDSHALQNPTISLDMDPSGNSYDPATNSMTVGAIDSCLTSETANPSSHIHQAHLVVQNVEDLVGWQVRMNYIGDRMRPFSFTPTPFQDDLTGQAVGFANLPLDSVTGAHRGVTPLVSIPITPADGTNTAQTALAGAVYVGSQTSPISPDSPAKSPADDTSYSAPAGGVLGSFLIQVVGNESAQPSLFVDLDTGTPNPPGSRVVVWTGTETADINLGEGALGDAFHGEGATCRPELPSPTDTPTPAPATPTATAPATPEPTATPAPTPVSTPRDPSFNPWSNLTVADTPFPETADLTLAVNLRSPDLNFADLVSFTPRTLRPATGAEVPDGAVVGGIKLRPTVGVVNNPCFIEHTGSFALDFPLLDATTDTANTITGSVDVLAGDTNLPFGDGRPDIKPPPSVTQYPAFLNALFDPDYRGPGTDGLAGTPDDDTGPSPPVKPTARYVGADFIQGAFLVPGIWVLVQVAVFEPGTSVPGLPAFDRNLGFPSVVIFQNPLDRPARTNFFSFCAPMTIETTVYAATQDNPDTQGADGGIPLRSTIGPGRLDFGVYARSQRDADGDGIENSLDTCPFNTDAVWNPRGPPRLDREGDSDVFVGQQIGDGIPDTCDPTPTQPTSAPGGQPTDHDGDFYANGVDNCPAVFNPDQRDSDRLDGKAAPDGIGDACDTAGLDGGTDCVGSGCAAGEGRPVPPRNTPGKGPLVPDGLQRECFRVLTLHLARQNEAEAGACEQKARHSPTNDDFADAFAIRSLPFSVEQSTAEAGLQQGEPRSVCGPIGATVWYTFTPETDMIVEASTLGSHYDTVLNAFTGRTLKDLQAVRCNDQAERNQSRLVMQLEARTAYHFQVSGFAGAQGRLKFSLTALGDCSPDAEFSFSSPDDGGDAFGGGAVRHDILSVSGQATSELLCLSVQFADGIDPADEETAQAMAGFVEFDTDQDGATGLPALVDVHCPELANMGVEAVLNLFLISGGYAPISLATGERDAVPVAVEGNSFTALIPLSRLGGESTLDLAMVAGTEAEATDCAPNGGVISLPP